MQATLFEYDTEIYADSVEVVPNDYRGYFASGTYQLDELTGKRRGRVTLHQLEENGNKMNTYAQIDGSGILDMKFNPEGEGDHHELGLALSDGTLSLLQLNLQKKEEWEEKGVLQIGNNSTICLSLDWSNQMNRNNSPAIAVSLSNGELCICKQIETGLVIDSRWSAHSLPYVHTPAEVWITSFDPNEDQIVFSGGDDGIMKVWDRRCPLSPCSQSSDFEAGVTAMCWDKTDPFSITVGSYDGHIRMFDKRNSAHCVNDLAIENNAGIWRIKYRFNSNYYVRSKREDDTMRNEMVVAGMRAGFLVLSKTGSQWSKRVEYLKQGTESLGYGVDYVYPSTCRREMEGYIASCSFYNHLMHVWQYSYSYLYLFEL